MQYYPFATGESPYCLWSWDVKEDTLRFLDSVDPSYFSATVKVLADGLESSGRNHMALAVRLTYFQALETFFALVGASLQAPHAPLGWLVRYRNEDLTRLVENINQGVKFLARVPTPVTWDDLSARLNAFAIDDIEKDREIKAAYARFWQHCATDYLRAGASAEHNGIKHGLRIQSTGFSVAVGMEDVPGVPARPEAMQTIGSSNFGSTYFTGEPVSADARWNFRTKAVSRAWDPHILVARVQMIAMSIGNTVGYLKILAGRTPGDVRFAWPREVEVFDRCWAATAGVFEIQMNSRIAREDIVPMSREDIIKSFADTDAKT